jgi:uncharacterized Zn finger protein (UPF0148 family)
MIAPFQCVACNAPLVVVDAPSLVCRYCGATNAVAEVYREELRLARNLDVATRRAIEEWARLDHIRVPRWWFVGAASAPFLLMAGGLAVILVIGFLRLVNSSLLPLLVGVCVWLPLVPAQVVAAKVGMRNLLVSGAASVGAAFAAVAPSAPGEPPNCRQCGAPLSVGPDDVLVRCLYCEAENIVQLDESSIRTLQQRVSSAQSSLAQAMAALSKHASLSAFETRGRTYIIAGLLVLPLVWSFAGSWIQSSYWSLLIALDVWVLGICILWTAREAFLPPVTIEELDALRDTLKGSSSAPTEDAGKSPVERIAGTRGWYGHAFDSVNFVVPASLALMFVVIEMMVLMNLK